MPWRTLELDPAVATERDVKRAYAKRLKNCRPDRDPEAFRKLHDAYTAALGELQRRGMSPAERIQQYLPVDFPSHTPVVLDEAPAGEVVPAASPVPDLSPGLLAVLASLDHLEAGLKGNAPDIGDRVRMAEKALYENPAEMAHWGQIFDVLLQEYGGHPGLRLTPEAILFELEHGGEAATVALIDLFDEHGNVDGIAGLAKLLLRSKQRIANPAGAFAVCRLARAAAFWVPHHFQVLANFAYELLPRGERDYHMEILDRHRATADLLSIVPDNLKSFWRRRIMNRSRADGWDDEESAAAIQWLGTQSRISRTFKVLESLLPEDKADSLPDHFLGPAWDPGPGNSRTKYRGGCGMPLCVAAVAVITLLIVVRMAGCSALDSAFPGPRLAREREQLEDRLESLRQERALSPPKPLPSSEPRGARERIENEGNPYLDHLKSGTPDKK